MNEHKTVVLAVIFAIVIVVFGSLGIVGNSLTASVNKTLTSPGAPIIKDIRYDDGVSSEEDSVAVWLAASGANPLLFVTHKASNEVKVWDLSTSQMIRVLTGFNNPNGVAVDQADGSLYVTDRRNFAMKKYVIADIVNGNTAPALVFGNTFTKSKEPMGVSVYHENGESYIYVTYIGSATKYIRVFNTDGTLHREWSISDITLESIKADDKRAQIYVSDERYSKVKVYKPDGTFVTDFGQGVFATEPEGIDIYECNNDGYIIVSDQKAGEFEIFDRVTYENLARFKIDDASDTDGIVLTQASIPNYPQGGFFVQSKDKFVEGVQWEKISSATDMTVCMNGILDGSGVDVVPPSTPGNLTGSAASPSQIDLSWDASTDNVGVIGYRVLRNGVSIATTSQIFYQDTNLTASTTYSYTVTANDAVGNESVEPNPVIVTTPSADTTAPRISNVTSTNITQNEATIVWDTNESSDSVVEYGLNSSYGETASNSALVLDHSVTLLGLFPGAVYHYRAKSKDATGNLAVSSDFELITATDAALPVTSASPLGGTYAGSVIVTLSANEPSTIYYTKNGVNPTESSSVYANPITLTTTTVLKYLSVDTAGNSEIVNSQIYIISLGSVNKNLISTSTPIVKDIRYEDGISNEEDSVAVWVAPNTDDSLLFTTHKSGNAVKVWNLKTNQVIHTLGGFNNPNGVAVDQNEGAVYVTDRLNYAMKKFFIPDIISGSTTPALVFGNTFTKSKEPMGVSVYQGAIGETQLYITYIGSTTKYVRVFTASGTFVREWPITGAALESIEADSARGLIYVADETNNQIKVYKTNGTFVQNFGKGTFIDDPEGIKVYDCGGDGYIIASDQKAKPYSEYEVFDRMNFQSLGRFSINDGSDTDGITIAQQTLPNYPQGGIFVQSRDRFVEGVSWQKIASSTKMSVCSQQ